MNRFNGVAAAAALLFLAGCPSGPLGQRPVAVFGTPETDGSTRDEVTIHLSVSDDDLSIVHLAAEYSVDGGAWLPATIVNSTSGTPGTGAVSNLPGTRAAITCDVVWDSWADRVGETGDATVSIRITPSDIDGVGEPVTFDMPAPVNNNFPELSIDKSTVAFTTDLLTMGVEGQQDPPGETIVITNTGPTGPLSWTSSVTYDAGNPLVGPDWLIPTPATGGAESVQLDADVDGSVTGTALVAGTYTARLEMDAGAAHASPQTVTVTLVVRKQRPDVLLDKAFIEFECIEGQTSPANQTFTVTNSGEDVTLYWWTSALPSWLSFSPADNTASSGGGLAQGAFDTVTVSIVNPLTLPARKYYEATITIYGEGSDGEPVLGLNGRTIDVRLWVKVPQRIDFDVTSLSFTGAIEEVSNPIQATQSVILTNGGEVDLDWTAAAPVYNPVVTSWLTVDTSLVSSPLGAGTSGQVDFIVDSDGAGIAAGTHTATVEFSDPNASNSPQTVTVTLEVLPRAEITCDTTPLDFYYYLDLGAAPGDQTVTITNPGATPLVWSAGDDASVPYDWLAVSTSPGTIPPGGTGTLTVSVDTSGMATTGGPYSATLTIGGTDGTGGQAAKGDGTQITVTLVVAYDPNLVGYWKMDDGSGFQATDSSGFGNHGSLVNMTGSEWTTGKVDGALGFDGANDRITVPQNAALEPTGGITVALWGYITDSAASGTGDLVRKASPGDAGYLMRWSSANGILEWHVGWPSRPNIVLPNTQGNVNYLNAWHHYAATYDSSTGEAVLYVDGVARNSVVVAPGPLEHTDDLFFMGQVYGGHDIIPGLLDDVRIYSRALSATEIYDLAGGINSGLAAHWKMDDGAGLTAVDSSGNGNHGALANMVGNEWTTGKVDGALSVDGANDYVGFGDVLNGVAVPFTVATWVNLQAGGESPVFHSDDDAGTYYGFWMEIKPDNTVVVNYGDGTGNGPANRRTKKSSLVVTPGTWVHIAAAVRGPTDMSLFVDGADAGGLYSGTGGAMVRSAGPAVLGTFTPWGPNYFNGMIDDVRIYSRALTAEEIYDLAGGIDSGLVAHWKLDDGAGVTATDSSGNGNDGTLVNNPTWTGGKVGGGLDFDGVDDYVNIDAVAAAIVGDFSFAAWVKSPAVYTGTDTGTILGVNTSSGSNVFMFVFESAGTGHANELAAYDGISYLTTYTDRVVADDTWRHVAYVLTGSEGRVYVDGQHVVSHTHTAAFTATDRWSLGQDWDAAATSEFMSGVIDDVRVYNRALSAAEVAALHASAPVSILSVTADDPVPPNAPDDNEVLSNGDTLTLVFETATNQPSGPALTKAEVDGLIGFQNPLGADYTGQWTAPDTLVITVVNASGGTLAIDDTVSIIADGTDDLTNAAGTNPPSTASAQVSGDWGMLLTTGLVGHWEFEEGTGSVVADSSGNGNDGSHNGAVWAVGKYGVGMDFGGDHRKMSVPDAPELNPTGEITLAAWVNARTWTNLNARIFHKGASSLQYELFCKQESSPNGVVFALSGVGSMRYGSLPSTGVWHHIAATYDGAFMRLYVDGGVVLANAATGTINSSTDTLTIGNKTLSWPFDNIEGVVDDARIYNRALSLAEIQALAGM